MFHSQFNLLNHREVTDSDNVQFGINNVKK